MSKDIYGGGYVPRLLLMVGFFLITESVTFVCLGLRTPGTHIDFLDFAFVLGSAILISVVGFVEARRDRPDSIGPHSTGTIAGAIMVGIVLGVCAGLVAFWAGNLAVSG
jgi:hypothetical protein